MSSSPETPRKIAPEDTLPPVEPPSATFIIQLFVVPAVIVAIIVVVWTLFNWLAQMGNDPMSFVRALERNNEARWQAAVNLADALRDPRNSELKQNTAIAEKLAQILTTEIEENPADKSSLQLRVYLCNALGEFTVPEVVPALIRAATTGGEPDEKYVRFAAIKGLAVFAGNLKPGDSKLRTEIEPVMLKASSDDEPLVRSTAAFALGALGDEEALERLKQLLVDANANVRFNAATMLASHGSMAAEPVLLEMLDFKSTAGVDIEDEKELREQKRETILISAMRAVKKLHATNPSANLSKLREAITAISTSNLAPRIRSEALEALKDLDRPSAQPASAK